MKQQESYLIWITISYSIRYGLHDTRIVEKVTTTPPYLWTHIKCKTITNEFISIKTALNLVREYRKLSSVGKRKKNWLI